MRNFVSYLFTHTQIAEMITFLLTLVYAVTTLLRVIEIYRNDGTFLPDQVSKYKLLVF